MRLTWAAGLAVLTAAALSGCGNSPDDDDAAFVTAAESVSLEGHEFDVMLPSGQFVFTVTQPRDELSKGDAADGESHEAPDGLQYVGLEWDWKGMAGRAFSLLNHDVPPQVAEVSVMTGDDELPVFELDTQDRSPAGRAWVLVSDDADPEPPGHLRRSHSDCRPRDWRPGRGRRRRLVRHRHLRRRLPRPGAGDRPRRPAVPDRVHRR